MAADATADWTVRLPGLDRLWSLSKGRSDVCIAVLDGPAAPAKGSANSVVAHAIHVQSIIAGSHDHALQGLAPGCTMLSVPIFDPDDAGGFLTCTQQHLASRIHQAIDAGAQIINISASQQADLLALCGELSDALQEAEERDVLVVAATGNQGCACDTIPASVPGVLAVGAHGDDDLPLLSSNWGPHHRTQGITAPGLGVPGSCADGGLCHASGTSFATAIVSGIAGLLMSVDADGGHPPSGARIRHVLLDAAAQADDGLLDIAATQLGGRLDVAAALDRVLRLSAADVAGLRISSSSITGEANVNVNVASMPDQRGALPSLMPASDGVVPMADAATLPNPAPLGADMPGIEPADCGCGCGCGGHGKKEGECSCGGHGGAEKKSQLAYVIGRLGISFVSAARRDSIWRMVNGAVAGDLKPISDEVLIDLFKKNPFQAQSVVWTLSRSEVPMYAIVPNGAFAAETYKWLVDEWSDKSVEFVSIPGIVSGQATLYDGNVVDLLMPDLRGMHSWETKRYVKALTDGRKKTPGLTDEVVKHEMDRFLGKIYFAIRNRGVLPEERALNAAATNAFNFSPVIVEAGQEGLTLRDISVERSPLNRPGSAYYDVLLTFFNPRDRQGTAPLRARFTIDVSDTVPVMIGDPVIWYEY